MHRYLLGAGVGDVIDHVDGNGLNNTRSNLRKCTRSENAKNAKLKSNSKSGIKGVMFETVGNGYRRWRATVMSNGIRHQKYFDTAQDADTWARAKREELHGAFARHS
jgi:hypothetical protein